MIRWDAVGSRNMRRITPTSDVFLGRSMSAGQLVFEDPRRNSQIIPSISAALSRSIRRILPLERARIKTLFATCAATKSEAMEN